MLRFVTWPASRNKPDLSQIYHKEAQDQLETDLCCSHLVYLSKSVYHFCKWGSDRVLVRSRATQQHRPSEWSAPAPDYSLPVFQLQKNTNKPERSRDRSTLTHSHTSITRHLESLFIQPQTAGVVSDRRNIILALVVHIWVCFWVGLFGCQI